MELDNIEKLLDKYFEGNTSLQEETTIRQYFKTHKVPAHLEAYQALFGYYTAKQAEVSNNNIKLKSTFKVSYKWLSVAATIAIILGIYIFRPQEQNLKQAQVLKDYATAQQALNMISQNLNKGAYAMAELQEFKTTKDKIFKDK